MRRQFRTFLTMRSGFSLVELLLVLAVVSLLTLIAAPRVAARLDSLRTENAAQQLAGAVGRSRLLASVRGRTAELRVGDSSFVIVIGAGVDSEVVWHAAGPAMAGVALDGAPRVHRFAAGGLGLGVANATYTLTRGTAERRVIVSRLGRVRIER